jgi:hypothetical protein
MLDVFIQAQVINLFNQFSCAAAVATRRLRSAATCRTRQWIQRSYQRHESDVYQAFNPFTTTPVEGVHWAKSPTFGLALNRFAYTTPRTFRLTFGLRF